MRKPVIRVIDLSGNQLGDRGALCFAELLFADQRIVALSLTSNGTGDRGGAAVFAAMSVNASLVSLNVGTTSGVGRNTFGAKACAAMGRTLAENRVLSELDVSMTGMTADTIGTISEGLAQNRTLSVLNLPNNNIQSRGTVPFINACMQTRISELFVARNHIRDDVSAVFAPFLRTSRTIRVLGIVGDCLTRRFTAAILEPPSPSASSLLIWQTTPSAQRA